MRVYTNILKVAVSDLPCFFLLCHMSHVTLWFSSKDFLKVIFSISQNCTYQVCYPGENQGSEGSYISVNFELYRYSPTMPNGISKPRPRQMPDKSQVKPTAKAGHCSYWIWNSSNHLRLHRSWLHLGKSFICRTRIAFLEEMPRLRCSGYQRRSCRKIRSRGPKGTMVGRIDPFETWWISHPNGKSGSNIAINEIGDSKSRLKSLKWQSLVTEFVMFSANVLHGWLRLKFKDLNHQSTLCPDSCFDVKGWVENEHQVFTMAQGAYEHPNHHPITGIKLATCIIKWRLRWLMFSFHRAVPMILIPQVPTKVLSQLGLWKTTARCPWVRLQWRRREDWNQSRSARHLEDFGSNWCWDLRTHVVSCCKMYLIASMYGISTQIYRKHWSEYRQLSHWRYGYGPKSMIWQDVMIKQWPWGVWCPTRSKDMWKKTPPSNWLTICARWCDALRWKAMQCSGMKCSCILVLWISCFLHEIHYLAHVPRSILNSFQSAAIHRCEFMQMYASVMSA